MRIVFMGTPTFAATHLTALLEAGYDIVGVFTKPDKPQGRGMKLTPSPVKEVAITHGLPCYQPDTLKTEDAYAAYAALQPDLTVVVAYGLFLPQPFLTLPLLGCINVHGSLLPAYRGAAPIQWAILNGETVSGVCIQHMVKAMDAGDVILSKSVDITENDTFGTLHDKIMLLGVSALLETIPALESGTAPRIPQDEALVTFAPLIQQEHRVIDWSKPASTILHQVRALQPVPCATTCDMKIHEAVATDQHTTKQGGTVLSSDVYGLYVACGDGNVICVTRLQAKGGKAMTAADYVRGHGLPNLRGEL